MEPRMESPRKFIDCYFYYYSTCTKGDQCVFRHEPSALGCEIVCAAWQQGQCLDTSCKLRHMELKKNRKQIPCYWESQPSGCRKQHCPFMHKNPEARMDGIAPSQSGQPQPVLPLAVPQPQPLPLMWQHHPRQMLLGAEAGRVLPPPPPRQPLPMHGAPHQHHDPLLINFDGGKTPLLMKPFYLYDTLHKYED